MARKKPKLKITQKQEQFALNIFKGMKQRNAYRDAYCAEKMSDAIVDTQASILMRKQVVAERIMELRKTVADRNIVTVEKVIDELAGIAFDDIRNYLEFGTDENGKSCVKLKESAVVDTRNISEVQLDSRGNLKFKLYPKDNALTQLGRYLGLFTDKTEITGKDGGPIEVADIRKKLIEKLAKKHVEGTSE